jgi:hypothetical protein
MVKLIPPIVHLLIDIQQSLLVNNLCVWMGDPQLLKIVHIRQVVIHLPLKLESSLYNGKIAASMPFRVLLIRVNQSLFRLYPS